MTPLKVTDSSHTKKTRSRRNLIIRVLGLGLVALIILNCSGLNIPVIGKQSSLVGGVQRDIGVTLPSSLHVIRAARLALRDPAYYYECEIPAADIPGMIDSLSKAAARNRFHVSTDLDRRFSFGDPPAWFSPGSGPDVQQLKIDSPNSENKSAAGYWFVFSPTSGKVWVFWYTT